MPPRLIARPGTLDEQTFDLKPGAHVVGRTSESDICLAEKSLSRAHARIDVGPEAVVLSDLGSTNGTFVDGERIERRVLDRTHTLKFGDVACRFVGQPSQSIQPEALPEPALTRSMNADFTQVAMRELVGPRRGGGASALHLRPVANADRDREKLRVLLKVSQLLGSPGTVDALLANILDLAFDLLDVDRAAILMVDAHTGELEPRVARSRKGEATFSRSIARYVREHSVAALFSDARADQRLMAAGSVFVQSIRTSMCAPLKPRDEVLGVLYVDNLSLPNRFDAEDLEFLSAFANQAAVAIENSMLNAKLAEQAVARNNLLRFFPPATVPTILEGGAALATVEREAAVLFCDISGYTAMSSRMKPTEIIELLNGYFPVMAEIVFRYDGTLEKYIGDALLAVWGVPLAHDNDAERAVRAAIDMQRAVRTLNQRWAGKREIAIHIGICTGNVAAGNIGSNDYIQYATIGDTTNTASRVCGVAGPGEIAVDECTAKRMEGRGFELAALGPTPLRGKADPLHLYRVEQKLETWPKAHP
jgi:adenylate cyclase